MRNPRIVALGARGAPLGPCGLNAEGLEQILPNVGLHCVVSCHAFMPSSYIFLNASKV